MKRIPNAEALHVQVGGTAAAERQCGQCGCTDWEACVDEPRGPCWWVQAELCSHCEIPTERFLARVAVLQAIDKLGTPCLASQVEQLVAGDVSLTIAELTRDGMPLTFVYPQARHGIETGRQFIDYRNKAPAA